MLGRIFLTLDAAALLFGAIIADWNETHIFNSNWPPHAKFHNAQTMTLSVSLGFATLVYTWISPRSVSALRSAAFTGSVYWLAGLASALFPGTSGLDPEFGGPGFPQGPMFAMFSVLALGGWLLEEKMMVGKRSTAIRTKRE